MIALAVILPLLIFLFLQFSFQARDQRDTVEEQALARTERVLVETDAILQRTLGALDVMAQAGPLEEGDWQRTYDRLHQIRRAEPGWVTARLVDLATGEPIFDLRQPYGSVVRGGGFVPPDRGLRAPRAFVGDMGGSGPGCPCALVYRIVERGDASALLLVVALDTRPLLRLLRTHTASGRIGGIVDRNGNFVARSRDHDRRVGTPATDYVRRAIRSGSSGIYGSRTLEGFVNYTAFSKSALSGWSAHIAFSTGLIDSPRWRSLAAFLFAALASLLLAAILIWFTLRQLAQARRVQERLQESQKLEALGQITGGIAHDFNNLLTPIVGGLGLLARKAELDPAAHRLVESALSAARRAAKLTGQLLAFSRRQKLEIGAVDLHHLFAEITPLLDQSAGSDVRVEVTIGDDVGHVSTDANQLELALLNLVLNARDAMPDGGEVSIAAHVEPPRRGQREMIVLKVRDTGGGMPRSVLRRATEPFFTTKASGCGTGLGLAQVYGIVRQSGGTLAIDSVPDDGTVVTLSLPSCGAPAQPPAESAPRAAEATEPGQRILLCDDDDAVRTFVARVLDDAGYVVESVSDGRSAVQLVRHAEVSLLVVDFAMHGMNGADVTAAARAFRPDLPVLMITGYADTDAVSDQAPGIPVLRKPFEAEALLEAARAAIAAGSKAREEG